ncbi:YcaO-like family protein [Sulfitobacter albidus]|uniref:YcaO-like family protein n=1 Tax=Sulfitobacter albidus TaxID=2829501 RepID=A0A975JH33_9RHOB|nr:YcaO-like family protein [Sulfitobacter albidus]QUJ78145.1 YcaO-like family protein [Sulfitobacter albidus]
MTDDWIDLAEQRGLISGAQALAVPPNAPLSAAVRIVHLRAGARPPEDAVGLRVAFGCGATAPAAARLAGFEAIERYALQFSSDASETLESVMASDGEIYRMPRTALALGAPGTAGTVSSKGAAAGPSPEAAAMWAVLECLEHGLEARGLTHRLTGWQSPLADWLKTHLRGIDLHVTPYAGVGVLVRAVCADFDGGRPTYGSAFGGALEETVRRAIEEAIVSWRNMAALEHRGVLAQGLAQTEARLFALYRGARADRPACPDADTEASGISPANPSLGDALRAAADVLGQPVAVFDMTAQELPLPVFKAVPVEQRTLSQPEALR